MAAGDVTQGPAYESITELRGGLRVKDATSALIRFVEVDTGKTWVMGVDGSKFFVSEDDTASGSRRWTLDGDNASIGSVNAASPFGVFSLPTESMEVIDAGSTGATEQDWVEVEINGVQGYLRVFAAK